MNTYRKHISTSTTANFRLWLQCLLLLSLSLPPSPSAKVANGNCKQKSIFRNVRKFLASGHAHNFLRITLSRGGESRRVERTLPATTISKSCGQSYLVLPEHIYSTIPYICMYIFPPSNLFRISLTN